VSSEEYVSWRRGGGRRVGGRVELIGRRGEGGEEMEEEREGACPTIRAQHSIMSLLRTSVGV